MGEGDVEFEGHLPPDIVFPCLEGVHPVIGEHGEFRRGGQVEGVGSRPRNVQVQLGKEEEDGRCRRYQRDDPPRRRLGSEVGSGFHEDVDISEEGHCCIRSRSPHGRSFAP